MDVTVVGAFPGVSQKRVVLSTDANQTVGSLAEQFCRAQGLTPRGDYALCDRAQQVLPRQSTLGDCGVKTGDELYLIISDQARGFWTRNYWWLLPVIFLLLVVVCAIVASMLGSSKTSPPTRYKYAIGLDAGSTHTQLYMYEWPTMKLNGTGVVAQVLTCPTGSAISAFTYNTSLAGPSLRACLDQAVAYFASIQAEGATTAQLEASTPVFLGGTAGMRLLAEVNSSVSNAILRSVRDTIGSYPFNPSQPEYRQRIIEGTEEGTFDWVATNYLLGSFGNFTSMADDQVRGVNEKPTVGAMDLGGASTQIAFASSSGSSADVTRLELYGYPYEIYRRSYLCYGINEAYRQYVAFLVQSQNFSQSITDPCAPAGNTTTYGADYVFAAPCTSLPAHLNAKALDATQTFVLSGSSNAAQCRAYVRALFNLNVTMPAVQGTFRAFSSYFYTMQYLNLTGLPQTPSLDAFVQTKDSYCNMTWAQVADIPLKPGNKPSMRVLVCFQANYVYTLLIDNYHFNSDTWLSISFQSQVNGVDLDWVLGMILNTTNAIPAMLHTTGPVTSITIIILFAILGAAFFLLFIGFASFAWREKSRSSGYAPVLNTPGERLGSEVTGLGLQGAANRNYGAVNYRERLNV